MNIRSVYLFLVVVLSLGLFFQWSTDKKTQSIENHLLETKSPSFEVGEDYVVVENEELYVVVEVSSGAIVETRLKKHLVEDVEGSSGYRVLGKSKDSAFSYYFKSGFVSSRPTYEVVDIGPGFVVLGDPALGFTKKYLF